MTDHRWPVPCTCDVCERENGPLAFNPGAGRPHVAAILARSDEDRLLAVLSYLAMPMHRATS